MSTTRVTPEQAREAVAAGEAAAADLTASQANPYAGQRVLAGLWQTARRRALAERRIAEGRAPIPSRAEMAKLIEAAGMEME